jgi:hypothetical protein
MFGIDLGITVSSVTCITGGGKILDFMILFGNTKNKDEWSRVKEMADAVVDSITAIGKAHPGIVIQPLVTIEEPVFAYRTRNPRSFLNLAQLYALIRNKLEKRNFIVYSANPVSVKATAKSKAFGSQATLKKKYAVRGRLTKDGMLRAFFKVNKHEPDYTTKVGRETLADSYFIAHTGLDRRRVGVK